MIKADTWRQCRLTGSETVRLKQIINLLPFVADFANAIVNVYVPSKNEGELVLFATERPHTIFFVSGPVGGSLLDLQEEPLVKYTFEKGKSIHGHREIGTGADEASIVMITMPIISDHRTIAVVTIETTEETINSEGYGHIIKAATNLIEDTSRDYTEDIYRPIGETDGVLIADRHDRIVFANLAAQRIYRVLGVSNPVGMLRRDRMLTRHVASETVKPGQPNEKEITAGGLVLVMREIPVEASGNPKGCIVVVEDVTALREKEKEIRIQKAVIREIHHRVKNNLQSIASLLNLQGRRMKAPEAKEALKESAGRVRSIATIHEYLSNRGTDMVDAMSLAQNLLNNIEAMVRPDFIIIRRISGDTFQLTPAMTTGFALAINEILLNIIKHAFNDNRVRGTIGLTITNEEDCHRLVVYDDGCGLPDDFDLENSRSLGTTLIKNFIRDDLGGTFIMENNDGRGTRAVITLPLDNSSREEVNV